MTATAPSTGAGDDLLGPPGWHADPWQRHGLRFYDGRLWTEHVADGGVAGLDSTPVAPLERSRPVPERAAPPGDPVGARVLSGTGPEGGADDGPVPPVGVEPLLLVGAPDPEGTLVLRTPDDRVAGRVVSGPPRLPARLGRLLVSDPSPVATRVRVLDAGGSEVLRLERPLRRTAAVVDVAGPAGPLGTVRADRVVRALRARVVTSAGQELGVLAGDPGVTAALAVTAAGGPGRARLTPVWDVPGRRHHLPPGVRLLDRRPPPGEEVDPATAALLLGALLAPALLRAPAGTAPGP